MTRVNTEGSKFWDDIAYGSFSGTFEWTFYMDTEYIEPFYLAFEGYSCSSSGGQYVHTFQKQNNARIRSFCIRGKLLNRMAGGPSDSDEVTELLGCIVTSVKFSMSAGESATSVTFSGSFADMRSYYGNLSTTDYQEYDGYLTEYSCLFIGNSISDDTYVSMIDSITISVDNNAEMLYTTCSPFAANYYEGVSNFTLSLTGYSNDPARFKRRFYSGGYTNTPTMPMTKGLQPCDDMYIASYDLSVRDGDADDIGEAVTNSDRYVIYHIEECVYRIAQWQKGDGSKLQDSISSAECRKVGLEIKSSIPSIATTNSHPVTSADPS